MDKDNDGAYTLPDASNNSNPPTPTKGRKKLKKNHDPLPQPEPKSVSPKRKQTKHTTTSPKQGTKSQEDGDKAEEVNPKKVLKPREPKTKPSRYYTSLPQVPDDTEHQLFDFDDKYWEKHSRSNLTKGDWEKRLKYYVRPRDEDKVISRVKKGKTKIDCIIGMKQIYFERPQTSRPSIVEFRDCVGASGSDYEKECIENGRLPKSPTKTPKRRQRSIPKPTADDKAKESEKSKPQNSTADIDKPEKPNKSQKSTAGINKPEKPKGGAEESGKPTPDGTVKNLQKTPKLPLGSPEKPKSEKTANPQTQRSTVRSEPISERSRRFVEESIRNALFAITYHDLSRHPQAFPREPVCAGIIGRREDFQKVIPAAFSANSEIYIEFTNYEPGYERWNPHWKIPDRDDTSFPIRGRGPVWANNSCAIDACIVAGTLLDAGSTIADRRGDEDWVDHLTAQQCAFLQIVEKSWAIMTREQSIAARNNFWNVFNREQRRNYPRESQSWQIGQMQPPAAIWEACTAGYTQFRLSYFIRVSACNACSFQGRTGTSTESNITPDYSAIRNSGVTLEEVLRRYFIQEIDCPSCPNGRPTRSRIVRGDLPPRLVILPHKGHSITNHTENVTFTYRVTNPGIQTSNTVAPGPSAAPVPEGAKPDPKWEEKIAEYRWLGGIYYHEEHFRVYWADNDRQEPNEGFFKVYDGMCAEGAIVGAICSAHANERIHQDWVGQGAQTILFYERVLNPTHEVLTTAARTIIKASKGEPLVSKSCYGVLDPLSWAGANGGGRQDLSHFFVTGGLFSPLTTPAMSPQTGLRQKTLSKTGEPTKTGKGLAGSTDRPDIKRVSTGNPYTPGDKHLGTGKKGSLQGFRPSHEFYPREARKVVSEPHATDSGFQETIMLDIEIQNNKGLPSDYQTQTTESETTQIGTNHDETTLGGTNLVGTPLGGAGIPGTATRSGYPGTNDPRLQHDPEPNLDDIFPPPTLPTVQPRTWQPPAPNSCFECHKPFQGTEYLAFDDGNNGRLYCHHDCFRCRRCKAGIQKVPGGIDWEAITTCHGPPEEYDGEAPGGSCGEYLDRLERQAKRAKNKRKTDGGDGERPKKQPRASGWAAINNPLTAGEKRLQEEGEGGDDEEDEAEERGDMDQDDCPGHNRNDGPGDDQNDDNGGNNDDMDVDDDNADKTRDNTNDESSSSGDDDVPGAGGTVATVTQNPTFRPPTPPTPPGLVRTHITPGTSIIGQDPPTPDPTGPAPDCHLCEQPVNHFLPPLHAVEFKQLTPQELEGQYITRYDEATGEALCIHVSCWTCGDCDIGSGLPVFHCRVRNGNVSCGLSRKHEVQRNGVEEARERES
jgi:hypothetical protein